MWNQTIAGRGANEILSYLVEYLTTVNPLVKTLTCYSDSCFGQNKNSQIICFWNHPINQKQFNRIDHKFLVRGHTYLPNDRDFAQIEKRKASARVHQPQYWEKAVREACPTKPFHTQTMDREKFLDFTPLTSHFTTRKKDSTGAAILISKAHTVPHPGEYWMRKTFSLEEPWQNVCVLKNRRKLALPLDIDYPIMYPNGHPINQKKVSDLQTMLPFLPSSCSSFLHH